MKKTTTLLIVLCLTVLSTVYAQSNYINYQGVASNTSGVLKNKAITVKIDLKFNTSTATPSYTETHNVTTDANGVFSLQIGNGTVVGTGIYNELTWGNQKAFITTSIDGIAIGTTEMHAVPFALNSGGGVEKINDLKDGKSDGNGSSLFLGKNAGSKDDSSDNKNVGIGFNALTSSTTSTNNVAMGWNALPVNTTGDNNTAVGAGALLNNISGNGNTAYSSGTLGSNTTGHNNTAIGTSSLFSNTTGNQNTATGMFTMFANTEGKYNTANGYGALKKNITGNNNTANGYEALSSNTTGNLNTANGYQALYKNTTGINNTANGYRALYANTIGNYNTANGYRALYNNTTGDGNTANGYQALFSNTTGIYNTAIGYTALSKNTTGSNNIGIGLNAQVPNAEGFNQVRIGDTNITYAGIQVAWTVTSDKRWKDHIRQLPYGLNMVKKLKPVDYIRKNNEKKTREIGFIAQDVEKVLNGLGYKDQGFLTKDDKGYISLRYNDLIPVLTKAIQEQQELIKSLQANYKNLVGRLEALETKTNQFKSNTVVTK